MKHLVCICRNRKREVIESFPDTIKDTTPFPKGRRLPYPYARVYLRSGWTWKGVIKAIKKGRYTIDDAELLSALFGIGVYRRYWKRIPNHMKGQHR